MFFEELRTNEELKEKLKALELSHGDLEGLVSLARESGFDFTADELKEISSSAAVKELSLDELGKVAGRGDALIAWEAEVAQKDSLVDRLGKV